MFCLKNMGTHADAPAANAKSALFLRSSCVNAQIATSSQKPQSQSYSGVGTME